MIHDPPYGWRVTYLKHSRHGAGTTQEVYGARGTQTNARLRAVHKSGFIRIVSMDPLTPAQYARQFATQTLRAL